jgi:hypothetical protein
MSRVKTAGSILAGTVAAVAAVWAQTPAPAPAQLHTIERGVFSFAYDERGISQLKHPDDPFGAVVTTAAPTGRGGGRAATLGLTIAYQTGTASDWTSITERGAMTATPELGMVR